MSDQTTNWDFPYAQLADSANIETAVRPLADRLETVFNTVFGTGTLTPAAVRDALGVEIGADVQAYDATLAALAALTTAANKLIYATGADTFATADLTAAGRALLDDADAAAQLTTLGVSTFIKTLLDDADAATARATLAAAGSAQPAWTAPSLSSPWTGDGVGYVKDTLGVVHLRGELDPGGATNTQKVFTLPAGSRPPSGTGSGSAIFAIATDTGEAKCSISRTSGDITILATGGGNPASTTHYIDGVHFPTW